MRKLGTAEKSRMADSVEESFNDVCTIVRTTITGQNGFGEIQVTSSVAPGVSCSFSYKPEYKNERGQIVTLDCDAILRVSLDESLSVEDIVICRGKSFTVDGVIDGRSVLIVALKSMVAEEEDDTPS